MNFLNGSEKPKLVLYDWPAERANVILLGEWLFGQRRRILDRITGIESGGAFVEGRSTVPLVGSAFGCDLNRAAHGAPDIRILLRSLDCEFLNRIRRKILQEAADVIVGVVHAVDRQHVVQAGAAAEGDSGDARFSRIGGFHWFGSGHQVSDVCETAFGEWYGFEIPRSHHAAINGGGCIHGLRGNGRGRGGDVHLLLGRRGIHDDVDLARRAYADRHSGVGIGETGGLNGHAISGGREIGEAEFSTVVASRPPFNRRFTGLDNNDRGRDAGAASVIDCANEAAAKVLGFARKYRERERQNQDEI